jgi:hypothetical protein
MQATGKSRNSEAIARANSCDLIVDDWIPLKNPITPGALHITNYEPDPERFAPDILLLPIGTALADIHATKGWRSYRAAQKATTKGAS